MNKFIYLQSDELEVAVVHPDNLTDSCRFDRTSFVAEVMLHAEHTFCGVESNHPNEGTGGHGLCNEFGIFTPIGYYDAMVGDQFPKLGVGWLTRLDDDPYFFNRRYPLVPYLISMEIAIDKIQYFVYTGSRRGYEVSMVKTLTVKGNRLRIDYELCNLGGKVIRTEEYCHNFIAINHQATGPEFSLKFPYMANLDPVPPLTASANEVRWSRVPNDTFYTRLTNLGDAGDHWWELLHEPSGVGMREIDDFSAAEVALWGGPRVISPEVFIKLHVNPGECKQWSREYQFFKNV